jgi:hypothetical protein
MTVNVLFSKTENLMVIFFKLSACYTMKVLKRKALNFEIERNMKDFMI